MYDLEALGFGPDFAAEFEQYEAAGLIAARVAVEHHGFYELLAAEGDLGGVPSGRLKFDGEQPAVGDWVAAEKLPDERKALIRAVLPRRTAFSRKDSVSSGTTRLGSITRPEPRPSQTGQAP